MNSPVDAALSRADSQAMTAWITVGSSWRSQSTTSPFPGESTGPQP